MRGLASCFEDFEGIWMLLASQLFPKFIRQTQTPRHVKTPVGTLRLNLDFCKRVFANVVRHLGEKCYKQPISCSHCIRHFSIPGRRPGVILQYLHNSILRICLHHDTPLNEVTIVNDIWFVQKFQLFTKLCLSEKHLFSLFLSETSVYYSKCSCTNISVIVLQRIYYSIAL